MNAAAWTWYARLLLNRALEDADDPAGEQMLLRVAADAGVTAEQVTADRAVAYRHTKSRGQPSSRMRELIDAADARPDRWADDAAIHAMD
jgi:hypothetical protein